MTRSTTGRIVAACAVTAVVATGAFATATASAVTAVTPKDTGKARQIERLAELTRSVKAGKGLHTSAILSPAQTATLKARTGTAIGAQPATASGSWAPSRTSAAPRGVAAVSDPRCDAMNIDATQTHDHTWLLWDTADGAVGYTVSRQRRDGALTVLNSSLAASATSYKDTTQAANAVASYKLTVKLAAGSYVCDIDANGFGLSLYSDDGWGYPDAVFAGVSQMFEQNDVSVGMPFATSESAGPTYSPDGQYVATTDISGTGAWSLTVRRASTGAVSWSTPAPSGLVLTEPAFSPDGRYLVVGAVNDSDESSAGLYVTNVVGSHALAAVSGSDGLITPDWVDLPGKMTSDTIVAAGELDTDGLVLIPRTGGSKTPIAGTSGAYDPTMTRSGKIYYTALEPAGTTSLMVRDRAGVVSPLQSGIDGYVAWPVVTPDQQSLYYYLETTDPNDPNAFVYQVNHVDLASTSDVTPTTIGWDRSDEGGFYGYDVRQALSKGTSDFAADANNDILARDSGGTLYVYPMNADTLIAPRVRVGGGWQIYRQIIAAGDFNGDNRGDVLGVDTAGVLWFYAGAGAAKFPARVRVGGGWGSHAVASTGDLNGDGRADLVGRDSGGVLWFYPGAGNGTLGTRSSLGSGWNAMNAIVGIGDWNYDNRQDVLARERSTGILWLYPGLGTGKFGARKSLGKGWNAMTALGSPEFLIGQTGLLARRSTGELLYYQSAGDGVISGDQVYLVSAGWNPYVLTS
jgi:hypothetical protein